MAIEKCRIKDYVRGTYLPGHYGLPTGEACQMHHSNLNAVLILAIRCISQILSKRRPYAMRVSNHAQARCSSSSPIEAVTIKCRLNMPSVSNMRMPQEGPLDDLTVLARCTGGDRAPDHCPGDTLAELFAVGGAGDTVIAARAVGGAAGQAT